MSNTITGNNFGKKCDVLIFEDYKNTSWFCIKGEKTAKLTHTNLLHDGVRVHTLNYITIASSNKPINTPKELERFLEEYQNE